MVAIACSHRRKLEEQLEKELRFHLDQYASDLIARGFDPEEARRQAHLAVGGPEQMKEECRDARGTRWIEDLWQDFRYAVRTLRHRPGFTAVAVITLALGIGASTAIFSAVNPILFQPLPYPHAGRVMTLWDFGTEDAHLFVTFGNFRELAERNRSFEAMAALKDWQPTMTGADTPERLDGQRVSAELLPSARRPAGAGPGIRCSGRPRERSEGGDPQLPAVAAAFQRRSGNCGA